MSLDQKTAIARAKIIRKNSIAYNFIIKIGSDSFEGLAEITFFIDNLTFDTLSLDFTGNDVTALIVNSIQVTAVRQQNYLSLPKACLQKGKNRVSVLYQSSYNNNGKGLVAFKDNQQQFLYTMFEPYSANRVFPCFDQPDLKAPMKLNVLCDEKLRVLSNESIQISQTFQKNRFLKHTLWSHKASYHLLQKFNQNNQNSQMKYTSFHFTKLISTYLYGFAVGNFVEIKPSAGINPTVPMSHFIPSSKEKNFRRFSDFIFDVTIKCMEFFQNYFQHPYPFSKYDYIWIRQFSFAAMQNVGLVVFNEQSMIPQEKETQYQMYHLALVVSHELSHHWFGNYVTMEWWDDLWLNESFAEFISCFSLEKVKNSLTIYKFQSPFSYFRQNKNFGYIQDGRDTATHPIRGIVQNTDVANSIFDGITYEKGAAVLKQLFYYVGEENMSNALQAYMDQFSFGNATINDLLDKLKPYFKDPNLTIEKWRNSWLQKASTNIFQCIWDAQNKSQTAELIIKQEAISGFHNTLRYHKMKVALFDTYGGLTVIDNVLIDDSGVTTVIYDGRKNITAVLVNHEDETFAQIVIDQRSLLFFMANIQKITDLLTRSCIWFNIQSMVKLSLLNISDYIDFILNKLFTESSNLIFQKILQTLWNYIQHYSTLDVKQSQYSRIFNKLYSQLQAMTSQTNSDRALLLKKYYIQFALNDSQVQNNLIDWLYNRDPNLTDVTVNSNGIWRIVVKAFELKSLTLTQKQTIFNYAELIDNSQIAKDIAIVCAAIVTSQAQLETLYSQLKSTSLSSRIKQLKAKGWRSKFNYDIKFSKFNNRVFQDIDILSNDLSYDQLQFFYTNAVLQDSRINEQVNRYNTAISKLQDKFFFEHAKNLSKFVDDLVLKAANIQVNIGTNYSLTQIRAINRFQYIKTDSIQYNFHITYFKDMSYYQGLAQIVFNLKAIPNVLPLDISSNQIYSLIINGRNHKSARNGQFILISSPYLILGENRINVWYKNIYNNDGIGNMTYTQTITQPYPQYTYTNFEPYGCHRYVPCFDQPDLKAPAKFTIIAPQIWKVVGNEAATFNGTLNIQQYKINSPIQNISLLQKYLQNKIGQYFVLEKTRYLSTYLYCIAAGQYHKIDIDPPKRIREIPMSLYCIKSYATNMENIKDFIFEMTLLSINFFEEKFQVQYPFSKYDSIFCHQYKIGAMENPGAITFNDTYLFPQKVSVQKMLQFGNTIIHQCSHNWFGNYATMKWWDDLWLNESFADYISHYCLQNIKQKVTTISYDSGWKLFLVRGVSGYRQDQITPTTHGIRSEIPNTALAQTAFDSITYQKGSATMKQFMFLMGENNFFKGLKDYFDSFAWSNGTIDNFLGKMQTYFDKSIFTLDSWKTSWLLTPSPNVMTVQWTPQDQSTNAVLTINQTQFAPQYPLLRYHKTKVAFFRQDATYVTYDVLITPTAKTTLTYDGSEKFVAVLVNVEYWGYFKYRIDEVSLQFFKSNLNKIGDVLTRAIIWHDINQAVRDAKIKVSDFIDIFNNFIYTEPDDKIFQFEHNFMKDALNNYIPNLRSAYKSIVFEKVYGQLKKVTAKNSPQNRIVLLKDQLTFFAVSDIQINNLQLWRQQANNDLNPSIQSLKITVTQAWQVIKLVYRSNQYDLQTKEQRYLDQYNGTPGIKGQLTKNTCDMIVADTTKFQMAYNEFRKAVLSIDAKKSYAEGWNSGAHLEELTTIYKPRYFSDILYLSNKLPNIHFQFFITYLKPIDDNLQQTIDEYNKIKLEGEDFIGIRKILAQTKYNYELRLKLYQFNQLNQQINNKK